MFRRRCGDCDALLAIYERERGELGLGQFLDRFIAMGVPRAKIEAVLERDPEGVGALRDRITADMANRLLAEIGVTPRQTAADVRRLRERGGGTASTTRPAGDAHPPAPPSDGSTPPRARGGT